MLIVAAKKTREATRILSNAIEPSLYLSTTQMRLPKQKLNMGKTTVGIQVSSARNPIMPKQINVFHFLRGAKRSCFKDRIAISKPKTKVM